MTNNELIWRELFYELDYLSNLALNQAYPSRSWGRVVFFVLFFAVFLPIVLLLLLCTYSGNEEKKSDGGGPLVVFYLLLLAQFLAEIEKTVSFALCTLVTLVVSPACLSLYLGIESSTGKSLRSDPTHKNLRDHTHQGGKEFETFPSSSKYYWTKFTPSPDRVLFPLFWTGVVIDLCFPCDILHAVVLWGVIKTLNFYHHSKLTSILPDSGNHSALQKKDKDLDAELVRGECQNLRQFVAIDKIEETLLSSCRLSVCIFIYFLLIRRLGSWLISFPVFTHLLGIIGVLLGQILQTGIGSLNPVGSDKDEIRVELVSVPESYSSPKTRRNPDFLYPLKSKGQSVRDRPLVVSKQKYYHLGSIDSRSPVETPLLADEELVLKHFTSGGRVTFGQDCEYINSCRGTTSLRRGSVDFRQRCDSGDSKRSRTIDLARIDVDRDVSIGTSIDSVDVDVDVDLDDGVLSNLGIVYQSPTALRNIMRRTSLPAALPAQRHSSLHQGSGVVDTALLYEAHGLVTEMLLDQAVLPPNIVAGLKALATLLKPTPTPSHYYSRPRPSPLSITTDPEYTSDVDEIPYTGEKISTMPKRNSGKKGVSTNLLLRRMSTSTWTTTTSATGMPTLEPQPHARRRRSASFRSAMEGTPPGSSPTQTQQYGLIPITLLENKENLKHPTTSTFTAFKMGTANITAPTQPLPANFLPNIPNAALQASHKARSFSAFALNASTDSRRRLSHQEFPHSDPTATTQRKTLCSLHPLSPSDLTHLNALAASSSTPSATASAAGSNRSSPSGTPAPSPIPSPVPSRDHSPCNFSGRRSSSDPQKSESSIISPLPPSTEARLRDCSPPKVTFQPEQQGQESVIVNDGDSLGLLSGRNLTTSPYLDNPDEDCSNASTLGDGPGPPDHSSSGNSNSVRLSPVTFTLQEPTDNNDQEDELEDFRDAAIVTSDGVHFHLPSIASDTYLCRLGEWDYPIFDLERSTKTQILSHMCYKVFLETGLFDTFKIPIKEFIHYFHALEMGYREKPYHNRMHAADVLQGVFYFTTQAIPGFQMFPPDPDTPNSDWSGQRACFSVDEASYGIMGANLPALELMALYTAAAMHDYDHPGRTNAFLVTTNSPQAILYNDRSVLENHHAAAAWALLMNNENYNFLKFLEKAEFKRFRFLVIEAILATDLKRHFEIMSEFNSKVNEEESPGIDWTSEEDRLLVMEICIKLADINGPCKFHDIHVQWTYRIAEEFYEQGDEEVRLGLPISPFMDRYHPQLAKLQESFINHLVAPLCKACNEAGLLPGYWEDEVDDDQNEGETTADELSTMSCQETDNDNEESSYSDDNKSDSSKSKRKIFCLHTKHLQDNHRYWMNVIKEEAKKKEEGVKTESVAISTEDPMETIEEENTPHSLNRSFSFEKEDSKL